MANPKDKDKLKVKPNVLDKITIPPLLLADPKLFETEQLLPAELTKLLEESNTKSQSQSKVASNQDTFNSVEDDDGESTEIEPEGAKPVLSIQRKRTRSNTKSQSQGTVASNQDTSDSFVGDDGESTEIEPEGSKPVLSIQRKRTRSKATLPKAKKTRLSTQRAKASLPQVKTTAKATLPNLKPSPGSLKTKRHNAGTIDRFVANTFSTGKRKRTVKKKGGECFSRSSDVGREEACHS